MNRPVDSNWWWPVLGCLLGFITISGCSEAPPNQKPLPVSSFGSNQDAELAAEATDESPNSDVTSLPNPEIVTSDTADTSESMSEESTRSPSSQNRKPKKEKVALAVPAPPEYMYEPRVLMTQQHEATCLIKVGQLFPLERLSDLEGQERSLKELLGEKLTVVIFWSNENRLGREQIRRLEAETVLPFENSGLNTIAINTGDPSEQIRDLLPSDREPKFTVLLDREAAFFSKVATDRHPRTYLLDSSGKVLWLDIEYSRSTARNLANAIHVYLGGRTLGDS